MRRLLLLLLAVIVPLKAIGAVVVPITGAPNHHHEHTQPAPMHTAPGHHADHQATHQDAVSNPHCDAMAQTVDGDAGAVHEHSCPHLGMVTLIAAPVGQLAATCTPQVDAPPAKAFTSIVLDPLVPPPTRTC